MTLPQTEHLLALQGLLSSLGHVGDNPSSDAKLSAEQVRKLSEKIGDILGDDAARGDQPSQVCIC